jgi:hypothetical protein
MADPGFVFVLLQRDTHTLGVGQRRAATTSCSKTRNHHRHANSVWIASSLRADLIFGNDRGRPIAECAFRRCYLHRALRVASRRDFLDSCARRNGSLRARDRSGARVSVDNATPRCVLASSAIRCRFVDRYHLEYLTSRFLVCWSPVPIETLRPEPVERRQEFTPASRHGSARPETSVRCHS